MRFFSILAGLSYLLALTACAAQPASGERAVVVVTLTAPPPSPTLPPTGTPLPPTSTPTPTPTITPLPSPTPCADEQGTVASVRVPSPTLRYEIDTRLYLPPCYAAKSERYPVLYLLHGLNFKEDQWEQLGVAAAADELIASGAIAPLIIVMPRDRRDARLDPALVKDLVPYIDATYRTVNAREARAIGGLSRGGGWAVHFGLKYADTFGRIGLHSPAVFYEDELNILEWARLLKDKPKPAIYIDTGENDATLRSPVWLDQVFTWFEFGHTFIMQPGGHTETYWAAHVRDYLKFYAADWRKLIVVDAPENFTPPEGQH